MLAMSAGEQQSFPDQAALVAFFGSLYRARQLAQIAINLWADLCRRPALASKIYRSAMTAAPKLAHGHRQPSVECPMSNVLLASVLFMRGSMVLGPWTVSWEAGVCQRLQFLVWMARGRHPFSGSFLHEWPSSRQTDVRPGYAWERVWVCVWA